MRRNKEWDRSKKGVAGIIAATILFAMIFTTGAAYFMFVQYNYQLQHEASNERNQMEFDQSLEQFLVGGSEDFGSATLYALVNNTGPVAITIIQIFYVDADTGALIKEETLTPTTLNPGEITTIGSGIPYGSGNRLIKILTARGNIGSGMYPPPEFQGVTESEVAQGFGMIRLIFLSFRYYTYKGTTGGDAYVLLNFPNGTNAFNSPSKKGIAFAVEVKNVDHDKRTIVLDSHTMLWQFNPQSASQNWWYIVNVVDNGGGTGTIQSGFTPISIAYGETKLIFFASKNDGSFAPASQVTVSWTSQPSAVFILIHGTLGTVPYGQNMPYSSVYWT
ncbi:MAG: hypothetical protein H3Z52_02785 [archaeon]|nr:hypothetical protein [archaeon]